MSLQVGDSQLDAATQAFKLQYGINTTCSSVSTWFDIGDMSSTTPAFRGYGNASVADGATISTTVLTGSDVSGTYEEENNSAANPNAIAVGQDAEWDWVLQAINVAIEQNYCFRMVKSDGTALNTYTRYPSVYGPGTTFDASFEGGNGENFVRVGDAVSFNSELDAAGTLGPCTTWQKQNWFYFSMDNVLNKSITLTLNNATASNYENSDWTDHRPVYSYDGITWYRIAATGSASGSNWVYSFPGGGETFTQDTIYIAHGIPYVYTDFLTDLTTWEASSYVATSTIGNTVQGRPMILMTIEDTNSPVAEADKKFTGLLPDNMPWNQWAVIISKALLIFLLDRVKKQL